eukprot:8138491-Alexandrium_andersonii.AAC.1
MDRPDFGFAAKECCRRMAAPTTADLGGTRQVDPLPGRAPAARLPFPVAGRWGDSPRLRRHGLRR